MIDLLALDLVEKRVMTNQIVITVGYDVDNLNKNRDGNIYTGDIQTDMYGRKLPKNAHGTVNISEYTSSARRIMDAVLELFDSVVDHSLYVRRMYITAGNLISEDDAREKNSVRQFDLFEDFGEGKKKRQEKCREEEREHEMQKAMLEIKNKYGKNALLKGMNLEEGGTTIERNGQIGGHKA